ncbi:MAG: ubiquinone biosynthesis protein UbiH [Hyphomicrobiales bacterium]|nr:MAG: ubiquinone biosynthesis protein UbiH [Hyphomicrobiales bacterium]
MAQRQADILIAGGGSIGLSLAAAFADALGPDARIVIVDKESAQPAQGDDPRAYAIAAASQRLVASLEAWDDVAAHAEPVTSIDISDSSLGDAFRPRLLGYDNRVDDEVATYIVSEQALRGALLRAVAKRPGITLAAGSRIARVVLESGRAALELETGEVFVAPLLVAADGRGSMVRKAAGIKTIDWDYGQTGIVTTVGLVKPHGGCAVQHFLPAGPFAILPLPGNRACITWSETTARAREILAMDEAGFRRELEARFSARLGDIDSIGARASWPLKMHLARSFVAHRVALAGDAAHGVHPLAGQGLNLGLRDVAALVEVIADAARLGLDIGDISTLERYERWRRTDSVMSAFAFDALNRLFSNDSTVLRTIRNAGLGVVDRMPQLKDILVKEAAGLTGDVPRLLRGLPV